MMTCMMTLPTIPLKDKLVRDRLAKHLGEARLRLLTEMLRFGVVGVIGFVVDSTVLLAMLDIGLGPYGGRIVSYVAAASATFALNRAWTFRNRPRSETPVRQWALFLLLNLVGFACNYGTYVALVAGVPVVARNPVIGVAAGSLAGMVGNFLLSRRFVFGAAVQPQRSASGI
jgi:putative flippase GtrA